MSATALSSLSTVQLERLLGALRSGQLGAPISRSGLQLSGLGDLADALLPQIAGLAREELQRLVEALVHDRQARAPTTLDLVWTGPDAPAAESVPTGQVVRRLFSEARHSVLIAGYRFDHGTEILEPLHDRMAQHGVSTTIVLDLQDREASADSDEAFVRKALEAFHRNNWPFGDPRPELYYDPRQVVRKSFVSMHAKCCIIDQRQTLLTSANFTRRGQQRNIEAGVLIGDAEFAKRLDTHWRRLIARQLLIRGEG